MIPNTAGLAQSIECLAELPHPVFFSLCYKTLWLMHIDYFFKFAIQECRFDINLMYLKVLRCCKSKEKMDGVGLGDRCKCFGEVDARFLSEALCN